MAEVSSGYRRPELLAETAWLQEHLQDPGIRIVDCDIYDVYRRAHLPNALGLRVHHYLKDASNSVFVMPPDQFKELVGSLGISNDTVVVAYDSFGSLYAARFWWVMNYYGHTGVKVLNGGFNKWLHEGRPVTQAVPTVSQAIFEPRVNSNVLCTLDHGKVCIGSKDTIFLDVRSDGEWTGENTRGNLRSGHIPGAVHLEWLNFVTDDELRTIKPAHELRAMLQKAGVLPEQEVVTY
ncbi:MAG: sulfurtransferase [Chloroflexi bacterium]|nr:sulfurtransferase [Chloroflexota bacterium]